MCAYTYTLYVYMYIEYICKLYEHMYICTNYMCICIQNIIYLNVNRNENTFSTTSTGFYTCIFIQNFVYVYDTIRFITLLLGQNNASAHAGGAGSKHERQARPGAPGAGTRAPVGGKEKRHLQRWKQHSGVQHGVSMENQKFDFPAQKHDY